jgi:replication factor C subunit 1
MSNEIINIKPKITLFQSVKDKIENKKKDLIKITLKKNNINVNDIDKVNVNVNDIDKANANVNDIKPIDININIKTKLNNKVNVNKPEAKKMNLNMGANLNMCSSSTLWAEKYRPTNISDIIDNKEQINQIKDWFNKFQNKDKTIKKALLFSGSPGTSKTTIAHAIFKEYNYHILEYNASDIRNKSQIDDTIGKLITINKSNDSYGIIMDEVDGMTSGDKGGMLQLIKIINPLKGKTSIKKEEKIKNENRWIFPIICICNNNFDKKMNDLKKECLEIKFYKPTRQQLVNIINNIIIKENFPIEELCKSKIADLCQGDYRRLMHILQNLYTLWNFSTPVFTSDQLSEYFDTITEKYISLNQYESANKIFGQLMSIDNIYKLYEIEKSSLPMMIHENYLNIINIQNTSNKNKIENAINIIDSIVQSDILEKTIFTTQSWHLHQIHCMSSCYLANYYSNKYPLKGIQPSSKWTTTLSKYSSQKTNIKNINYLNSIVNSNNSYRIDDIKTLSEIILFNLLNNNGNIEKGINILKHYNLTIGDIEKLIRTDQLTEEYKDLYKSKNKTALTKQYGNIKHRVIHNIVYNNIKPKNNTEISDYQLFPEEEKLSDDDDEN